MKKASVFRFNIIVFVFMAIMLDMAGCGMAKNLLGWPEKRQSTTQNSASAVDSGWLAQESKISYGYSPDTPYPLDSGNGNDRQIQIKVTHVLRGKEVDDIVGKRSFTLFGKTPEEGQEYLLVVMNLIVNEVEDGSVSFLDFGSFELLKKDGLIIDDAGFEESINKRFNAKPYPTLEFGAPGSANIYALFCVEKGQERCLVCKGLLGNSTTYYALS